MNILKSMIHSIKKDFFNFSEFFQAIANNDTEKFEWCLNNRIDKDNINKFNTNRDNALSYICEYNRVEFLDKILPLKPSTNIKNHEGKTPLFLLCEKLDGRDTYLGYRDLMFNDKLKANDSHDKIVLIEKLLNYGTDIDSTDYQKNTPLMKAITNKFEDVAVLLLKHGADATVTNKLGHSALSIALMKCQDTLRETLVEAIYNSTDDIKKLGRMALITEANTSDSAILEKIKSLQIKSSLEKQLYDKPEKIEKKMKI
jgi:ankyrin repeat protein